MLFQVQLVNDTGIYVIRMDLERGGHATYHQETTSGETTVNHKRFFRIVCNLAKIKLSTFQYSSRASELALFKNFTQGHP
jgi:hypothetical protein